MNITQGSSSQLKPALIPTVRWLLVLFVLLSATACVFDPDEGGITGTGYLPGGSDEGGITGTGVVGTDGNNFGSILRGTVSEQKENASRQLLIRSQSGERSTVTIEADGKYVTEALPENGPWLLRSDIEDGVYQFGLGYASGFSNVHSYIDVVVRAWYFDLYGITDLNAMFLSDDDMPALPTLREFLFYVEPYLIVLTTLLKDYGLLEFDLFRSDYRNNETDVNRFLTMNPMVLQGQMIDLVRTDPVTNIRSFVSGDLLLDSCCHDAQAKDTIPPTTPENLRAFGSSSGAVTLVWDAAVDNSAVYGHVVFRNGQSLGITAHTTYTDEDAELDTVYRYEVIALDLSNNRSAVSASVSINNTAMPANPNAPIAPRELTKVAATARLVKLSWVQDGIDSVRAFQVFRGPTVDDLSPLDQVTGEDTVDTAVDAGTEYCYAVSALNSDSVQSRLSDPVCIVTDSLMLDNSPE